MKTISFLRVVFLAVFLITVSAYAQYCTPNNIGTFNNNHISNVAFGNVDNTTAGSTGAFTYFDNITTERVLVGQSLNGKVTVTLDGWNRSKNTLVIWINFNRNTNSDFEDNGEQFTYVVEDKENKWDSDKSIEVPFTINIPNDAHLGNSRIRIGFRTGKSNSFNSCDYKWQSGEIEDYNIEFVSQLEPEPEPEPETNYPQIASMDFDGVDDYLQGNSVLNGLNELTIMAWIKLEENVTGNTKLNILGEDNGCRLFVKNNNNIMFGVKTSKGVSRTLNAGAINKNEWHHVAGTFSSSSGTVNIYLDGKKVKTSYSLFLSGSKIQTTSKWTGNFEIGRISRDISNKQYFKGEIDEVRVFNQALTDTQIQTMVYQEIQNNNGNVRGVVVPKDIIDFDSKTTVPWASLVAYYPMTNIASNKVLDFSSNNNNLTMFNISTVQEQTAPMPYKTIADGAWNSQNSWLHGNVWDVESIPEDREWSIVAIENDIELASSLSSYGLIINTGKTLTVNGNNVIKNTGYFELNGALDLMNDSQLIQTKTSDLVTSADGKVLRRQEGTPSAFWYNYWASPVGVASATTLTDNNALTNNPNNTPFQVGMLKDDAGFNMQFTSSYTASGNISSYWMYTYKNGKTYWDWARVTTTTNIEPGVGYTQKGTGVPFESQQYIFEGKPNNGTILIDVKDVGGPGSVPEVSRTNYLLGNPYPSALDIHKFIQDNRGVINGNIQLWQQWSGSSHNLSEYNGGYAQVSLLGATRAYQFSGISGLINLLLPGGNLLATKYLPVGQGFVTEIVSDGKVEFNNAQRAFVLEEDARGSFYSGSVFFKNNSKSNKSSQNTIVENVIEEDSPFKKIRLAFTTVTGPETNRELLLGFSDETTDGYDYGYDTKCEEINNNDLNLAFEGENMNMQAYANVTPDKVVPLNFKSSGQNAFKIKITELINFEETDEIYIKDNFTGEYFDLKHNDAFNFTSEQGKFNDRFQIVFQSEQQSLSAEEAQIEENFIYYLNSARRLYVKKSTASVKRMAIVSMTGQTVLEMHDVSNEALLNGIEVPNVATGAYVAYLRTDDNQVLTKKIIIN